MSNTRVQTFEKSRPFALDDFQRNACIELDKGNGVLVAAPTGAGKTVVGEFALALALNEGTRAFYTTPIKALSNQKYHDFVAMHGADNVGLLTGDTSLNPGAHIVVMTTEVLRNMLYAGSAAIHNLGYVVMDEVHYLADRFRGPVWEEVILHLPERVQLVSLSATVSNAEEFGQWLQAVRGDTSVIVSEHRPVPLSQHVVVGHHRGQRGGMFDLYEHDIDPTKPGAVPPISPELLTATRGASEERGSSPAHRRGRRGGRGYSSAPSATRTDRRGPPRYAVIELLDSHGLLPAINFIFSRNGCEAAVDQCLRAGLTLTTAREQTKITEIVEARCADVPEADLSILGYRRWLEALQRGIGAHHAGLLPLFKETVEELFVRGLLKAVFATETLALGINMPARSVVLDKLVKWNGQAHVDLTPGEYTQLTGRAGRRGIDVEGHAVVVEHPGLDVVHLAGLASKRLYPLRSSFRPTYNMAVNLVETMGRERTREILEMSFAQFQADRSVVDLARTIQDQTTALDGYRSAMACDRGDFTEYAELRSQLTEVERTNEKLASQERRKNISTLVDKSRAGEVLYLPGRRHWQHVLVTAAIGNPRARGKVLHVITEQGRHKRITADDIPHGSQTIGSIALPKQLNTRQTSGRNDAAALLRGFLQTWGGPQDQGEAGAASGKESKATRAEEVTQLREQLHNHPCHDCPDREDHARWGERWHRLNREHQTLQRKIQGKTGGISHTFDRICRVLQDLGYLSYDAGRDDLVMTGEGAWMRRLYVENDLLVAECLRSKIWHGLDAPALAAVMSTVIFESRTDETVDVTLPGGEAGTLNAAIEATVKVWSELEDLEKRHRLSTVREPDLGIAIPIHRWAMGRSLARTLHGTDLAPGDFVRWTKQVIDVLGQLAKAAPEESVRRTANKAADSLMRGVVAYSSIG